VARPSMTGSTIWRSSGASRKTLRPVRPSPSQAWFPLMRNTASDFWAVDRRSPPASIDCLPQ
jgi:hypothetical protein